MIILIFKFMISMITMIILMIIMMNKEHTHNADGDSAKENEVKDGWIEIETVAVLLLVPALVVSEISSLQSS